MTYHHIHAQWDEYLGRFLATIIVLFAVVSTILNAMQVELGTEDSSSGLNSWPSFSKVSRWFAVITIILVLLTVIVYLAIVIVMMVHNFSFAKRVEYRKRSPQYARNISEMRPGVM